MISNDKCNVIEERFYIALQTGMLGPVVSLGWVRR
jgi:hypothetical protein